MAIQNRTVTIKNIFAENANTTIPNPPVSDVSYRNTDVTAAEIGEGWPYKKIVDSAKFNEAMYEYTTICKQLEKYGFLPWCADTDYPAGGCALGTDGNVYQAKVDTGPSTTSFDPVNDTSHTYWDLFYYSSFTADRAIASNSNGKLTASSTTATELEYVHGVTSAIQTQINSKANTSDVVNLTGGQIITGAKTFVGTGHIVLQNPDVTYNTAPSTKTYTAMYITDKNGHDIGCIENVRYTTGETETCLQVSGETGSYGSRLALGMLPNGTNYTYCPASDRNGSIVTTTGINKNPNGYVKLGNGLIIQWGYSSIDGGQVTLPTPFSNTSYRICATYMKASGSLGSGYGHVVTYPTHTTSFYANTEAGEYQWIAIGY